MKSQQAQKQEIKADGHRAQAQQSGTQGASRPAVPSGISLPMQRQPNRTGLPDNLKAGIENLSGHSLDDVKVRYNSAKPATLQAHAYAQGTDIHIAPGQEKHLPHEAWHVVQQKQGRVKPTMQMKGGVAVNDDDGLEKEADLMGARAENEKVRLYHTKITPTVFSNRVAQLGRWKNFIQWIKDKLGQGKDLARTAEATKDVALQHVQDTVKGVIRGGGINSRFKRLNPPTVADREDDLHDNEALAKERNKNHPYAAPAVYVAAALTNQVVSIGANALNGLAPFLGTVAGHAGEKLVDLAKEKAYSKLDEGGNPYKKLREDEHDRPFE